METKRPTPEQIRAAVVRIGTRNPAYAPILDFYGEVFVAQEQAAETLAVATIDIPEDRLRAKTAGQFPLIATGDFELDVAGAETLLAAICSLAGSVGGTLGPAAAALKEAVAGGRLAPADLFFSVIDREGFDLAENARKAGIPGEHAALLAYHSVRPCLVEGARRLAGRLDPGAWKRGICPVCGSPPILSVLGDQGGRRFVCGFCWHEWPSPRIFCPFCETTDARSLHHIAAEDAPGCRADLCDACRKYIKTVDTRDRSEIFYPPLEQLATLHFDVRAREMGYGGGTTTPVEG